jgi:hypothetical protein
VLGPLAHVRRARSCAKATVRFAEKHPELRSELIEWSGASRISPRLRTISRIPLFPKLATDFVATIAEIGALTPLRSTGALRFLRDVTYTVAYWSTLERNGGLQNCSPRRERLILRRRQEDV